MPARIITLSQKDQDLLRLALNRAEEWLGYSTPAAQELSARIKDLKERILLRT